MSCPHVHSLVNNNAHVRLFLIIAINAVQKHFDPFLSTLAISSQILPLLPAWLAGWNNQSHPDRQGYHHYMTKPQLCHHMPRLVNGHKKKAPTYYYLPFLDKLTTMY